MSSRSGDGSGRENRAARSCYKKTKVSRVKIILNEVREELLEPQLEATYREVVIHGHVLTLNSVSFPHNETNKMDMFSRCEDWEDENYEHPSVIL